MKILKKFTLLTEKIKKYQDVLVAFSGGVDSGLLAFAALRALPEGRVKVCHLSSVLHPGGLEQEIRHFFTGLDVSSEQFEIIEINPLEWNDFVKNDSSRCYVCKRKMYETMITLSPGSHTKILDGTNTDDLGRHRPGLTAIRELGIETPYLDCNINKSDIRLLARYFRLSNHDLPANSCLAARIRPGEKITADKLKLIDHAEKILYEFGYTSCRVRPDGGEAVIKLAADELDRLQKSGNILLIQENFYQLGLGSIRLSRDFFG